MEQYEAPRIEYTDSVEALLTFCKKHPDAWFCGNDRPPSSGGGSPHS